MKDRKNWSIFAIPIPSLFPEKGNEMNHLRKGHESCRTRLSILRSLGDRAGLIYLNHRQRRGDVKIDRGRVGY